MSVSLSPSVESETVESKMTDDSYAYLEREQGFSSEKFKIEIRGLPKFYGVAVSFNCRPEKLVNNNKNLDHHHFSNF